MHNSVTFIDSKKNVRWTFVDFVRLEHRRYGVIILCSDGFKSFYSYDSFDSISINFYDVDEDSFVI